MSGSLNHAQIIGNLTRDPELRRTSTGQSVTSFSVATNRVWKDASGEKKEETEFHNVVAWGRLAEICSQYLGKGRKVYVDGRLRTRDWEGQDGTKRRTTEIIAENMIMLDRSTQGASGNAKNFSPQPTFAQPPVQSDSMQSGDNIDDIKLEDIPF
jgi:single-strand DNA-binding protein